MRIVKLAVISVVVIFVILTAMSSLLPAHTLVSRAVDIRGSSPVIKDQLFHLQHWENWLTDAKGQKAVHVYKSPTLSIGETRITAIGTTDSSIITKWEPGSKMTSTIQVIDHRTADSLFTVQWQMEQRVKWYPWEKFASITKDEIWGGAMEKSLENLKNLVESGK